jgi:hypothetical protein
MSPNAIIEGLKQGNAIELGVLRDVKEGMNAVVDGMINECLNRSDGLSDLMEKVRLVRVALSDVPLNLELTLNSRRIRARPQLNRKFSLPKSSRTLSKTASRL